MENNISVILGKNVKKLRIKAGFTINQLSKKAKINRSTLLNIEKGIANPLFSTIIKLSKALNSQLHKLFEYR